MVFNPETRSAYEDRDMVKASLWFDEYGGKVILKANDSSEGKDVFAIFSKEDLKMRILDEFASGKDSVSICPFYNINYEYRTIFLDGRILYCYKKEKPYIIGNGKNSLGELILKSNILETYKELDLSYIPNKNEKIEVSWKHNLSQGAIPICEIDEETRKRVEELAIKAGNAIGIRFASVDIAELETGELLVMEINSSVCMNKFSELIEDGRKIEKNVFEIAIDRMFE